MIEFLENLNLLLKSTFSILKHYSYFGTRFRFIFETKFNYILGRDSSLFWYADSILEQGFDFEVWIRIWGTIPICFWDTVKFILRHNSIYFGTRFRFVLVTKFRFWSSDSILEHKIVTSRIITGYLASTENFRQNTILVFDRLAS